ncbi:MAG: hypothetical protein ACRCZP_01340 [Phycicoccus sp.]
MLPLTITPDGSEPYDVVAKTRHIVAWEKLGKGRSLSRLEQPSLTDLVEIAHVTAVREGKFAGTFQEFLDSHEVAGTPPAPAPADDESGPTPPAP